jgi:hypothetical protein
MKTMSKAYPSIPVGHPDYKWKSHGDVQAVWRRFGWVPPSESMIPPPPEKLLEYDPPNNLWRIK